MKIDNMSFNAAHYQGVSETDFIKEQLASVPDKVGAEAQKKEFLKAAYLKINPPAEKAVEKTGK